MPETASRPDDDPPGLRSPKRALARSFRLSRDRWKLKAAQRRRQIKALLVRLRDLEISRELWKDKAAHLEAQLQQLRGAAEPQAAGPPAAAPGPPPKKARRARR